MKEATTELAARSVPDKNELLFQNGINFDSLPAWQKRGTGLYWETYEKQGYNPRRAETVTALRRRLKVDEELPLGEEYTALMIGILGCP